MKKISNFVTAGLIGTFASMSVAQAADVVIGVPNWPSVNVTANVLKVVLEDNLGLEVELRTANNAVVFEAMDKNDMHVHPEVWLPNQDNLHNKYVKKNKTVKANPNGIPGVPGHVRDETYRRYARC